ncbi:hypothetical protein A5819_003756 [Enterococcus sp. 7E2_DIV0204]|uniref:hypothetical protein n=1 Tax=unclassified Enterococcus TaxID=2608891 RepID=UPI000A34ADC1|nr:MULTISPECIES: hypothetical protein [unclassified Enterococcus]OTN83776.1 hypothetical protein A5819_003756 [Enterococcus sp. 7E2_DIV0204]OTP47147.1 hypothetical protein A5884_003684 [Enterococcus sp. 7D2_DIV0200]
MKILANVFYGLKESFWFMSVLTGVVLLEEFFVLVFYNFANSAHIPLTNFDLFMENIYYLITIFSLFSGFFLLFMVHIWKVKRVSLLILANGIVALLAAYSGGMHLAKFETLFFLTYKSVIISFVCAVLCSAFFRVSMNKLFRQLFTQTFQDRCELYPDEDNVFYRIKPLKKAIRFFYSNFRINKKIYFSPLNWEQPYESFSVETGDDSPFKVQPKEVINDLTGVTIRFKYVPQSFRFYPQSSVVVSIKEPVLLNQKNER